MNSRLVLLTILPLALLLGAKTPAATVWLDDLDVSKTTQDWGDPHKDKSVDGHDLSIGSEKFPRGLGTHANSTLYIDLKGGAKSFSASVGVDAEVNSNRGSIDFSVIGDGKVLWQSGVMRDGDAAKTVNVDLSGVKFLILKVGDANDGITFDHADWANAKFETTGASPETVDAPAEKAVILTPSAPQAPRINGATVFGVRPGHPFLFQVPATGERPMKFSALICRTHCN